MPRSPDYQGLARISSGKSHMADSLQYSTRDNLMAGRGVTTEFATSKPLSSSPHKSPYNVKLPSIRSLIEDVPGENLNGLPHHRPDRVATATSPSELQIPFSSTALGTPRAPPLFSIRTHTENSATWDHNSSLKRSEGAGRQIQSPSFSPHAQHPNSSGVSLSNLGHQRRLENVQNPSSSQLMNSSSVPGSSRTQPIMLPVQQPLALHNSTLVPRRVSYSQMQEATPQQYHQHHISTKTSAIIADQQAQQYVCQQCSKVFSRPSSLKIHGHSHTGEKPFRCPHADCGKTFSVRSNMKRHEKGCHEA